jgi:ADP-ribose pyrophosphatase
VGPYNYHNTDIRGFGYYTNNPPAGAFRGFGVCQSQFALESLLNVLAKKVGISPWEIRYRNAIEPGLELPNGQTAFRELIRKNGAVCVVALTENDEVLLVNQCRYPYATIMTEIPAGKLDGDEDHLLCARRELSEETGYEAETIIPIGEFYPSPAIMDEILYMYVAKGLKPGEMHTDDDEFIENEKMPLEELVQKIIDGKIPDGKTQAAVLKAKLLLGL